MTQNDCVSPVSALLVGVYAQDRELVRKVFREAGWTLFEAQDRRRALYYLNRYPIHVVIAEKDTADGNWKALLRDLDLREPHPQMIVTSRLADDRLWAEALNIGAFDVLAQPFERKEMERAVESARRHVSPAANHAQPRTLTAGAA